MRQVSGCSCAKEGRSAARFLCELGAKTLLRLGLLPLFVLTASYLMFFSAGQDMVRLYALEHTPYELTAPLSGGSVELPRLLDIEGVEGASPIVSIPGELEHGENKLDVTVTCVYGGYLDLSLTEGAVFPDRSNMPYLVLDRAAVKALSQKKGTSAIHLNDTLTMYVDGQARSAVLCGIFDDGDDLPAAYMSYDTARRLFPQEGGPRIAIRLRHAGAAPGAVAELRRYGLEAGYEQEPNAAWALLRQSILRSLAAGALSALCAAAVMLERDRADRPRRRAETTVLLAGGMTLPEARGIEKARLGFQEAVCFLLAAAAAALCGMLSPASAALAFFAGCVHLLYLNMRTGV